MKYAFALFAGIILAVLHLNGQTKADTSITESMTTLQTATGDIQGSLTLPSGKTGMPLVIIVPGSGPTDRNGNNTMGLQPNTYQLLAAALGRAGIATLRFDKRGIGQSRQAGASESDLRFETYVDDLTGWIRQLKNDKRFGAIVVLGHSEGSLIGMLAIRKEPVNKYISLAGTGVPADEILKKQMQGKLPDTLFRNASQTIDSLKAGYLVTGSSPALAALFRPSVQPYLISWMKYHPQTEIAKLTLPVLIVHGTRDLQVPENDARLLHQAAPKSKLSIIKDMNHVLKTTTDNAGDNMGSYTNPHLPITPELLSLLTDWILK